jgi:uncharacterized protein (UPF0332 family)
MSLHADLLRQARQLATHEPRRPLQASLRRAVSAAYYALFHLLVHEAGSRLVSGAHRTSLRHCLGRAFGHADMKAVAQQFATNSVSPKLAPGLSGQPLQSQMIGVAATFVDLQQARHEADYDTARRFTRQEVLDLVDQAEQAFTDWRKVRTSLQADTFLVGLLAHRSMRA